MDIGIRICFIAFGLVGLIAFGLSLKIMNLDQQIGHLKAFKVILDLQKAYAISHDNYLSWIKKDGKPVKNCDKNLVMLVYYKGKYDAAAEIFNTTEKEVKKILHEKI